MTLGRNDPCHCGSGKKYKKCCAAKDEAAHAAELAARAASAAAEVAESAEEAPAAPGGAARGPVVRTTPGEKTPRHREPVKRGSPIRRGAI